MNKNQIILLSLISIFKSASDTIFAHGRGEDTLVMVLTEELEIGKEEMAQLFEVIMEGDKEEICEALEHLLMNENYAQDFGHEA